MMFFDLALTHTFKKTIVCVCSRDSKNASTHFGHQQISLLGSKISFGMGVSSRKVEESTFHTGMSFCEFNFLNY
jgi:hypothetical protein